MQDKDFDQLFRDQLAQAEVEAPAMLWENIAEGMAPKAPKKRKLSLFWMAASLAVLALSASLLFHTEEKIQLHNGGLVLEKQGINVDKFSQGADNQDEVLERVPLSTNVSNVDNSVENLKTGKRLIAMQPSAQNDHLSDNNTPGEEAFVYPDAIKTVAEEHALVQPEEAPSIHVTAPTTAEPVLTAEEIQDERKGIRNVGDLVNFVVDKVDKREDKLIQFNTDDDENSSLVSINIGILKFNKKQKERR